VSGLSTSPSTVKFQSERSRVGVDPSAQNQSVGTLGIVLVKLVNPAFRRLAHLQTSLPFWRSRIIADTPSRLVLVA
jgi:hypothetical protein